MQMFCAGLRLALDAPVIMGILNVTPDSFSDGGSHMGLIPALDHARKMAAEGAGIIDVGGESTRPGSAEVAIDEELARVLPVVRALAKEGFVVSVATRHAEVAGAAVAEGAAIINDITGFGSADMIELARSTDVGLIVMHMQGTPKDMQQQPHYTDVVAEVEGYLLRQARMLEDKGVARERIAIDPGPGFGKDYAHNLALLKATGRLAGHGYPLVAAWSRKGFIGALTGVEQASERVAGSVAVACWAACQGARILRVHDVAATAQALAVIRAIEN